MGRGRSPRSASHGSGSGSAVRHQPEVSKIWNRRLEVGEVLSVVHGLRTTAGSNLIASIALRPAVMQDGRNGGSGCLVIRAARGRRWRTVGHRLLYTR